MASSKTKLSTRGEALATPTGKMTLSDVICDLWHPETNPGGYTLMHKELIEHMTKNFSVDSHSLTCGDGFSGSHRLRDTIARFVNRNFNPHEPVTKNQLVITSGVGQAVETTGFSICDKGDGILLGRPYYGNFPIDLGCRVEAKIIGVSFKKTDPFSLEAIEVYEKALVDAQAQGIRVKALLLCNPHNPLGRCYTREVTEAYMTFCQKYNLHLICDEIYALSVWKNPKFPEAPEFTSVLAINPDGIIDRDLIHVVWGMSKDFGSNGIRIGCVISRNEAFIRACEAISNFTCPSSLADLTTSRILSDDAFVESFISSNRLRLADNYTMIAKFLDGHQIPYKEGSNAGLFIWADLFGPIRAQIHAAVTRQREAGISSDKILWDLEEKLYTTLLKHRIFLALGADFGGDVPGWFRIAFAHEKMYLQLGLDRVIEAVEAFRRQLESMCASGVFSFSPGSR
ncbi:uncharacterized protein NECHADRAFT_97406 [Fusarium vanettenii 77-13-4]|uniref:Aminotransferase class I/classII large domain-containing protein n=1 Tax=Fusarium vanettenii (strain ATCC MYA-4622 / CBS 123669 / FGSC 9596 / NRRL 45880 / 77-13-4) TaxID=660122 RepID=C7ZI03_FUSV7|nr:uncharacterized protein NECHADRAFT_97406 [Fusarium vanettenii 77-13-4]EEU36371.1 hypothetical protein NECHADRAFT_97406 [Fusarium vanettenii 77-13-4]